MCEQFLQAGGFSLAVPNHNYDNKNGEKSNDCFFGTLSGKGAPSALTLITVAVFRHGAVIYYSSQLLWAFCWWKRHSVQ